MHTLYKRFHDTGSCLTLNLPAEIMNMSGWNKDCVIEVIIESDKRITINKIAENENINILKNITWKRRK